MCIAHPFICGFRKQHIDIMFMCVCGMNTVCSLFVLVSSWPIGIDRTILSMEKAAYGGSLTECQGRHMDGGGRTGVGMHVNIGENVRGSA